MKWGVREGLLEEAAWTGDWKVEKGSSQSMVGRGPDVSQSVASRVSGSVDAG